MHVGFEQEKTVCCACTYICTRIVTNNKFYGKTTIIRIKSRYSSSGGVVA